MFNTKNSLVCKFSVCNKMCSYFKIGLQHRLQRSKITTRKSIYVSFETGHVCDNISLPEYFKLPATATYFHFYDEAFSVIRIPTKYLQCEKMRNFKGISCTHYRFVRVRLRRENNFLCACTPLKQFYILFCTTYHNTRLLMMYTFSCLH